MIGQATIVRAGDSDVITGNGERREVIGGGRAAVGDVAWEMGGFVFYPGEGASRPQFQHSNFVRLADAGALQMLYVDETLINVMYTEDIERPQEDVNKEAVLLTHCYNSSLEFLVWVLPPDDQNPTCRAIVQMNGATAAKFTTDFQVVPTMSDAEIDEDEALQWVAMAEKRDGHKLESLVVAQYSVSATGSGTVWSHEYAEEINKVRGEFDEEINNLEGTVTTEITNAQHTPVEVQSWETDFIEANMFAGRAELTSKVQSIEDLWDFTEISCAPVSLWDGKIVATLYRGTVHTVPYKEEYHTYAGTPIETGTGEPELFFINKCKAVSVDKSGNVADAGSARPDALTSVITQNAVIYEEDRLQYFMRPKDDTPGLKYCSRRFGAEFQHYYYADVVRIAGDVPAVPGRDDYMSFDLYRASRDFIKNVCAVPSNRLDDLISVADEAERFAISEATMGTPVGQRDTGKIFIVVDPENLNNDDGYDELQAGSHTVHIIGNDVTNGRARLNIAGEDGTEQKKVDAVSPIGDYGIKILLTPDKDNDKGGWLDYSQAETVVDENENEVWKADPDKGGILGNSAWRSGDSGLLGIVQGVVLSYDGTGEAEETEISEYDASAIVTKRFE